MDLRFFQFAFGALFPLALLSGISSSNVLAQTDETGYIVGRVFEVDKKKYHEYEQKQEAASLDEQKGEERVPAELFLTPRKDVTVLARQLENNVESGSGPSNSSGDYVVSDVSHGVFEFTLQHGGEDYPVAQRLGANVSLGFVAELCFVLDREEKIAWMISAGPQRSPEVPSWVPQQCQSPLGACLITITGQEVLPEGLMLIFAGSATTMGTVGVFAGEHEEASSVVKK